MLSVVVPIYNEEKAVKQTFASLAKSLSSIEHEIIAVNDGSRDGSKEMLEKIAGVKLVNHSINKGYGASLKTGIKEAGGDVIGIVDADGTYPIEDLPKLYQKVQQEDFDMVVGARIKSGAAHPILRKPGKIIIIALAEFLVGRKIPDLNSGMRVFKKDLALRFWKLFPERWSFTVTITLASLTNSYNVHFEPIDYHKRIGTSEMNFWKGLTKDFPNFILLIIRITTYFKPLKFFLIPGGILLLAGVLNLARTIYYESNISDASLLLLLIGLQIGFMGILADLIVKSRD